MIELFTGKPGAGKTYWAVRKILEENAKGRQIYTDIDGLNIEGVLEAPTDWRKLPKGALCVYDEVQRTFGPDNNRGRSQNPLIAELEVHRHYGIDLWLITQHPNLLHAHVRRLVGAHHHVVAVYNSKLIRIYTAGDVIPVDQQSSLLECDVVSHTREEKIFGYYKSTELNTHKARMPRKTLMLAGAFVTVAAILMVGMPVAFGMFKDRVIDGEKLSEEQEKLALEQTSKGNSSGGSVKIVPGTSDKAISGCMMYHGRCGCFSPRGEKVEIEHAECVRRIEAPGYASSGLEKRARREPRPVPEPKMPFSGISG